MQGLYELKNHEGWSVSRDDDLQVMYRHHAGLSVHARYNAWLLVIIILNQLQTMGAMLLCLSKVHICRMHCCICECAEVSFVHLLSL